MAILKWAPSRSVYSGLWNHALNCLLRFPAGFLDELLWEKWVENDSIAKPFTFTVSASNRFLRQRVKLKVNLI